MSDTSKTKSKRRRKAATQGRDRKQKLEKQGTTPKFPIHPEEGSSSGSDATA